MKALVLLSTITVLGVLNALGTALAAGGEVKHDREGGYVVPCSLVGVNPVYHPEIFGNPVAAREYGFVQSRDGTWQVGAGCGTPASSSAASAYAPRPESQKAIRRPRR
jgi:hypothetical protein